MKSALLEIYQCLIKTGMSRSEAELLIARFLEEEAQLYVSCKEIEEKKILKSIREKEKKTS